MKLLGLFCLVLCLVAVGVWIVFAADVPLKWDAVSGAAGYKVFSSGDGGTIWSTGLDVGNVTTRLMTSVAEDRMVLFKVGAYNAVGESVSHWQGAWYDHRKKPIQNPGGLGIP